MFLLSPFQTQSFTVKKCPLIESQKLQYRMLKDFIKQFCPIELTHFQSIGHINLNTPFHSTLLLLTHSLNIIIVLR